MGFNKLFTFVNKNIYMFVILIIGIILYVKFGKQHVEPFSNSDSYNNCINSGYTKEFCVKTPTSVLGPSACLTPDGQVGYRNPGFGGKCVVEYDLN